MTYNLRKAINDHMVELLGQVTGVKGVFHNRGELPPREKTPGIIYLDGTVQRKTPVDGFNITQMPPAVFTLHPEVVLALTPRDNVNNDLLDGIPNPVDVEMAAFEQQIVGLILSDDTLVAMVGDSGSVIYDGFESDMRNGSTIGATGAVMIFKFAISYVLDPSDFV